MDANMRMTVTMAVRTSKVSVESIDMSSKPD